jgi:hypothetical protein
VEDDANNALSRKQSVRDLPYPHPFKPRQSLLDDEGAQSLIHLVAVLFTGWTAYTLYTNYEEKGHIVDWQLFLWFMEGFPTMISIWLAFCVSTVYVHLLVRMFGVLPRTVLIGLYLVWIVFLLSAPVYVALQVRLSILMRMALMMQVCVLLMKTHSYFRTNWLLQDAYAKSKKTDSTAAFPSTEATGHKEASFVDPDRVRVLADSEKVRYPRNVTLHDYVRFLCFPALVYEINYPRVKGIRWWYVAQEWSVACYCYFLLYLLLQEAVQPVLVKMYAASVVQLFAKLALPSLMVWMILFYGVFHAGLNGWAEICRFADREFYLDWWSARSLDGFWRLWNRAVYKWMTRHVYIEAKERMHLSSSLAAIVTFVTTAILHEYVLTVAFGVLRPWLFWMIHAQIPLLYFTKIPGIQGSRWGNVTMWVGFLIGSPMLCVLYAREYIAETYGNAGQA